jgi:4-carboxymuconolactone decarboxylase
MRIAIALLFVAAASSAPPRISPAPESSFTDADRQLIATYGQDGKATNDLLTYLNHPVLARDIMPFERYISNESTLPPRDRELLILRTAALCRSEYVWVHHVPAARKAGITADELTRIARGPDAPGWRPFEAALLQAADELHVGAFVSDATWAALAAKYDTRQLIDATFTVGEITMVSGTVNSARVQIEDAFKDRQPNVSVRATVARNDDRLTGKKPRIVPLEPSEFTPAVRQLLDPNGTGRTPAAVYRTYAYNPAMDRPRTIASEHIRGRSTLSPRVRELLIMRVAVLCRSEYEWGAHAPAGRRTGMTDADVQRVVEGPEALGGTAAETELLRAVDELHRDDVISDATWSALSATLDAKQLLDVIIAAEGYRMFAMAINTFGVQLEPGAERFPASLSR